MQVTEEEGFFIDQPVLEQVSVSLNVSTRPTDFLPRYVNSYKFLKLEPSEVIETSLDCQILYSQQNNKQISQIKTNLYNQTQTIQKHYSNKNIYEHVYNRWSNTEPEEGKLLSDNFFPLTHLNQYNSSDYSVLKPFNFPTSSKTGLLQFDSRFEGGNLSHAFYNKQTKQYHLIMHNDLNTNGYTQWFYFSVSEMKQGQSYVFNIVNFRKSSSLFCDGMLPAIYSFKRKKWFRAGNNVKYQKSRFIHNQIESQKLYKLSFQIIGQENLMISSGLPYSYTRMMKSLRQIQQTAKSIQNINFQVAVAGYSLSSNIVPVVSISSTTTNDKNNRDKKVIVITSRQHSGEVWSSYLCESLMWELLKNQMSQQVLSRYIFKIFPMINVDGVIYGNFRCDMGGSDLNRRWKQPCKYLHPQIFSIKQYLTKIQNRQQIQMYFDLHGHSKKMNAFCYCCNLNDNSRIFPLLLSDINPLVSFKDCTFGIDKTKIKTSRGFMFDLCQKINILTVQCSAFGYNYLKKYQHFQPKSMNELAFSIFIGIWLGISQQKQFKGLTYSGIRQQINSRQQEFNKYDEQNKYDSGSDSDPEKQQLNQIDKAIKFIPKKIIKAMTVQIQKKQQSLQKRSRKLSKKNRSSIKSNPKLIESKKEFPLITQEKIPIIAPPIPVKKQLRSIRQKSKSYHKQFEKLQERILPLRSVVISKTPIPDRQIQLSKVIENISMNPKTRVPKKKQKQSNAPSTHTFETKLIIEMPMIRRRTLASESQCEQAIKQTKSHIIKKQSQKIPQVRVFNQKLLKARTKQKGLCLISQAKQMQHLIKRQMPMRRQSCIVTPYYSTTKKKQTVINYQTYKSKQRNKSSLLNEVSKLWKFHVEKYTKQLQYQT